MFFCICRHTERKVDIDFPRTLAPTVWPWFKSLSCQLAVYFCVCDECYWEKNKNRVGSLRKYFLMAVFCMCLSLNWSKRLGQLWYELFQSAIGMNLPILIFSQMTMCQVTVFHLKATISVKGCILCLVQYSGDWCLMHLNTEWNHGCNQFWWKICNSVRDQERSWNVNEQICPSFWDNKPAECSKIQKIQEAKWLIFLPFFEIWCEIKGRWF